MLNKQNVVLFGASNMGKAAYEILKDKYDIIAFCDNDKNKWKTEFCGINVISPSELLNNDFKNIKVIITSMYFHDIECQLEQIGITDVSNFNYSVTSLKYDKLIQKSILNFINEFHFEKNIFLHVMIDSPYSDKFIQFINTNFSKNENKFVIVINQQDEVKYINNYNKCDNVEFLTLDSDYTNFKLIFYIKQSKKLFIHYLTDYMCKFICKFNVNKYTEINWVLWSADLYSYIDIKLYQEKTTELLKHLKLPTQNSLTNINQKYRKEAVEKIDYILTFIEGDYDLVKENFCTSAKLRKFYYPNVTGFNNIIENNDFETDRLIKMLNKYDYVIQLGNSGDPLNNHIDALNKLEKIKNYNFCVICPLSYGNKTYINHLIEKSKKILGDRFIPLMKFMKPDKYLAILNRVDIAIFNHNIQQAVGNILALMYNGKKIFMKDSSTLYKFFLENDFEVYDVNLIEKLNIFDKIFKNENKSKNRGKIKKIVSNEKVKFYLEEILKQ